MVQSRMGRLLETPWVVLAVGTCLSLARSKKLVAGNRPDGHKLESRRRIHHEIGASPSRNFPHPVPRSDGLISKLGRALQSASLLVLPLGILLELTGSISLRDMLILMVAGVSAFWLGRVIEGYAGAE